MQCMCAKKYAHCGLYYPYAFVKTYYIGTKSLMISWKYISNSILITGKEITDGQ